MTENLSSQNIPEPAPLVEVRRGSITESRHRGHIIAVDADGEVVARLGSPELLTFLRSSCKPFQALPFIISGAADRFNFNAAEIAIACGSHSGEPVHTKTVRGMLRKIGLDASALKCGVHEPFSAAATKRLRKNNEAPNVLQNNCSGKHAAMLAQALHIGAPIETYDAPDNPVQLMIGRTVAEFSDAEQEDLAVGIDGCGVPVFGTSVRQMALMYARLVSPPKGWDAKLRAACKRIVSAMTEYPELVGGTKERLDTEMMRAAKGALISKVGAEGVYTVGVRPSKRWPRGLGLALKIEDGEDRRGRPTVVIESLRQLGVLRGAAYKAVEPYASFTIRNHRGDKVGEVRAAFELNQAVTD
jgi:L-asparaginase II